MQNKLLQLLIVLGLFMAFLPVNAQDGASTTQPETENSLISIDFGADIMSRYVWRGTAFSTAPSIQPGMELCIGNLAFGDWGAYSFDGINNGAETDLYLTYSFLNDMVSVTVIIIGDMMKIKQGMCLKEVYHSMVPANSP